MSKRRVVADGESRDIEHAEAEAVAPEAPALLALQQGAGNAAVSRMMASGGGQKLARWANLGTESWSIPGFTSRSMTVWTGTKSEWAGKLDNIDDEDEYNENIWGFLQASNDPGIVGRETPPAHISSDPESVNYQNTVSRIPTSAEKLAFLEALYEKAGDLDLWHGGALEGGAWIHWADQDLAQFIQENQGLYLAARASAGERMDTAGLTAVAEQGGRKATMAMITNGGASAHKGVDLMMAANGREGRARETGRAAAYQLIRNSAQTMRAALAANDARVAFEQAVVGFVFDQVWEAIPGGGAITSAGKALLKAGLDKALEDATADEAPGAQIETINNEFVRTVNGLVDTGHINADDAQHAINGFEAGIR